MPVIECDVEAARKRLAEAGAEIEMGNTEYEHWRATYRDGIAVGYDDKVVIQGPNPQDIERLLRPSSTTASEATLYFDGASRGNPGPAAIGWVIEADGRIVDSGGETIGTATNNQAEWQALERGLEVAIDHAFDEITINGDSELIIKQLTGAYDTNDPTLREHRIDVISLLQSFTSWEASHVPRSLNDRADSLANEALDQA